MSEKKTIQKNPDLFKFPEKNTTKKNKSSVNAPKIKMKSELSNAKSKTLRRSVLRMIRERQQDEYKQLFEEKKPRYNNPQSDLHKDDSSVFDNEFNNSVQYLSSLVEKNKNQENLERDRNRTLKKYPNQNVNSLLHHPMVDPFKIDTNENVSIQLPNELQNINMNTIRPSINNPVALQQPHYINSFVASPSPQYIRPPIPKYGCLKNGQLPTYRTWKQHTQRNNMPYMLQSSLPPIPTVTPPQINRYNNTASYSGPNFQMNMPTSDSMIGGKSQSQNIEEMKKRQEIKQQLQKMTVIKNDNKIKYLKRRKIYKRTYKIGKSKTQPKVSVLVSNRTLRSNVSAKTQLLKQTPIIDVKQFLMKRGFIKVGTTAPNDVLRKMYESVFLICGEVQNHNPENLLYNFIHDKQ